MKYAIKNWSEFQHYKDRNPPWIKLHFALLSSSDWVALDDASRALAVACMLLASRSDGQIDGSNAGLAYIHRVAYLNSQPNLKPLIECGFLIPLQDASVMHADARPETETETETEKSRRQNGKRFDPPTLDDVKAYCRERGKGVDPHKWHDFYQSKGWMVGKNKMKDWQAAVRTWEKPNGAADPNAEFK